MLAAARGPQSDVQDATVMPGASCQQQVSLPTGSFRGNVENGNIPSLQQVLSYIGWKCFQNVDPSKPEELNGYLEYLTKVRNVLVVDTQQGSLIIIVECSSLEILDGLWVDYDKGHLNDMAQKYLVTEDLLQEFGLTEVKLTTTILKDENRACREYFLRKSGEDEKLFRHLFLSPSLFRLGCFFSDVLVCKRN